MRFGPHALVAAAGGFEANIEWLKKGWGDDRRQLPDPRHAPIIAAPFCACCWTTACGDHRRSDPVPRCGDRRARTQIRRRHHHAPRLRGASASSSTSTASASTTRARTSGPSATRSGDAWSRRSPTRSPTSSSMRRSLRPVHAVALSGPSRRTRSIRELGRQARPRSRQARRPPSPDIQRRGAAGHLRPTPSSTTAAPRD